MGITPQHGETILSQMAKGILRDSALSQIVYCLFSTAPNLTVAANTGFSAFPMLAYNMARAPEYMPLFMEKEIVGYSNGILTLAFGAMKFFCSFLAGIQNAWFLSILSEFLHYQTGMIRHWKKKKALIS